MPSVPLPNVSISGSMLADRDAQFGGGKAIDLEKVFDISSDGTNFIDAKQLDIFVAAPVAKTINLSEVVFGTVKALAIRANKNVDVNINALGNISIKVVGTKPAAIMLIGDVTSLVVTTISADTTVQIGVLA
jgi:hypothetical protein